MNRIFDPPDAAATPLAAEERLDLKLAYIADREELNAAEQENILHGQAWALERARDLLTERFVKDLHRHMLGNVWKWAGKFRTSPRNIGMDAWEIPVALRNLLADARLWIEQKTYPPDEIAVRFHHRLVQIHPFADGNGRHARLIADLLAHRFGRPTFTWGRGTLGNPGDLRKRYIATLHAADRLEIGPLIEFARS